MVSGICRPKSSSVKQRQAPQDFEERPVIFKSVWSKSQENLEPNHSSDVAPEQEDRMADHIKSQEAVLHSTEAAEVSIGSEEKFAKNNEGRNADEARDIRSLTPTPKSQSAATSPLSVEKCNNSWEENGRKTCEPHEDIVGSDPGLQKSLSSEFSDRVKERVASMRQSFADNYEKFSSSEIGDALGRAASGDFAGLHPLEECLMSFISDLSAITERAFPCYYQHEDTTTETHTGPTGIKMIIDTPAGPYERFIPDALVEDAIQQGFIDKDEVERQRASYHRIEINS